MASSPEDHGGTRKSLEPEFQLEVFDSSLVEVCADGDEEDTASEREEEEEAAQSPPPMVHQMI